MAESAASEQPNASALDRVETARLTFRASDEVREGILELIRADFREHIGRSALILSSNFSRSVVRLGGALQGEDAQVESSIGRAIKDTGTRDRKQPLARYAMLKAGKRPSGEEVVSIQLGVVLNPRLRSLLKQSPNLPDSLIEGRTLPVRTIIPREILTPAARQLKTPPTLNELLYGYPDEPVAMDFQQPAADNINAYVTDMNLTFQPLRRPKNRK